MAAGTAYACFAGTELWNASRVAAYVAGGFYPPGLDIMSCDDPGPTFWHALGEAGPYVSPAADGAPWYDAAIPESANFAGLLPLAVDGLDFATFTRTVTERPGDGGILGIGRLASRQIVVHGVLVGKTCCSVEYGLQWLLDTLRGSACTGPCGGDDLMFLACIPCLPSDTSSPTTVLDPEWRTLHDVSRSAGLSLLSRIGSHGSCGSSCSTSSGGCCVLEVEFTLTAANPYAHHDPVVVAAHHEFDPDVCTQCGNIIWVTDCAGSGNCLDGPCAPAPLPAIGRAVDPCQPCEPLSTTGECFTVPEVTGSADAVAIVTLEAGPTGDLINPRVRFFSNPMSLPDDELDPRSACGTVMASRIPASSVLTVDGAAQTVMLTCPGADPIDGSALLGPGFSFPTVGCGGNLRACADVSCVSLGVDAFVSISIVPRDQ